MIQIPLQYDVIYTFILHIRNEIINYRIEYIS